MTALPGCRLVTACASLVLLIACGDATKRPGLGASCTSDEGCESGLCLHSQCVDPDGDDDTDGLTNRIEAALGTDHEDADSDDDGQEDGAEVDSDFANRGYASEVARVSLDEARAEQRTVRPICSFYRWYIDQHPEYADLLA